jgi:hypothetical protein
VLSGCVVLVAAIVARVAGRRAALVGAFAVLAVTPLGFPLWTIVNYSQIALLFCLAAVWCVVRFLPEGRLGWLWAAGVCAGLATVTKQNLGAMISAVAATTLALDWLRDGDRRGRDLPYRFGALAAGGALVVGSTLAVYALRGTLGDLVERAVLGSLYLTQPYFVPLPGFDLWALRSFELAPKVFAHFPSPLFDLMTDGRIDGSSWPLFLVLEHLVKAAYYVPVALFVLAALGLARGLRSGDPHAVWSQRLAILLLAVASYASMLYRADWTHLMNVYPALILLAAVLAPGLAARSRATRAVLLTCVALWFAAGAAMTAVVLSTYRVPLETPRGRVRARPTEIAEVRSVLAFLGAQPRGEPLLFLRADPLYYFLADRRIPGPFDLVVPGYLTPEDDADLAARLGAVEGILYDPSRIPTMATPITEYAPRTSAALASGFRVERLVTPNSFLLRPRAASPWTHAAGGVDLWERVHELEGAVRAESWLVYRVIAFDLPADGERVCFGVSHPVRAGESVAALPMLSPDLWMWARGRPGAVRARFEIHARAERGPAEVLWEQQVVAAPPPAEAFASLAAFAGRTVELGFCAEITHGPGLGTPGGWGEPRIVRAP